MALRAGAGFALQAARSVRGQSLLTRAAGALPPKSCGEYGLSASTIRRFFSSRRDTDSLLRDNIRHAVSKGLKEVLATADSEGKSILKLSVIKSGVNAAVKDSVKGYSVVIDYAEHNVDPAVKLAIEEAVVQGLNKFANQLYNAPLKGEIMGPYLLKLALKEGITEALQCIHKKFVLFVGDGIDRLMIELSLIRALTKPNGKANVNEDFVQVWFCGLVHKFVNNEVIWYVDKAWVMIPYVAGTYLSLLFGITLIESKIPPWEYHKVLNCYRVHGLESALKFYKEKKEKAEEEAAAKKKAEEEEAAAKAEEAAAKKKAEEEEEVAAKKKTEEAAAKKKAEEAAAKKKAEEAAPKKKAEEAAAKKKAEEAAAKKKAEESAGSGEK